MNNILSGIYPGSLAEISCSSDLHVQLKIYLVEYSIIWWCRFLTEWAKSDFQSISGLLQWKRPTWKEMKLKIDSDLFSFSTHIEDLGNSLWGKNSCTHLSVHPAVQLRSPGEVCDLLQMKVETLDVLKGNIWIWTSAWFLLKVMMIFLSNINMTDDDQQILVGFFVSRWRWFSCCIQVSFRTRDASVQKLDQVCSSCLHQSALMWWKQVSR